MSAGTDLLDDPRGLEDAEVDILLDASELRQLDRNVVLPDPEQVVCDDAVEADLGPVGPLSGIRALHRRCQVLDPSLGHREHFLLDGIKVHELEAQGGRRCMPVAEVQARGGGAKEQQQQESAKGC